MAPSVMSIEDFLGSGLLLLDKNIQERVSKASLDGKVLRYVCVIEDSRYSFLHLCSKCDMLKEALSLACMHVCIGFLVFQCACVHISKGQLFPICEALGFS